MFYNCRPKLNYSIFTRAGHTPQLLRQSDTFLRPTNCLQWHCIYILQNISCRKFMLSLRGNFSPILARHRSLNTLSLIATLKNWRGPSLKFSLYEYIYIYIEVTDLVESILVVQLEAPAHIPSERVHYFIHCQQLLQEEGGFDSHLSQWWLFCLVRFLKCHF